MHFSFLFKTRFEPCLAFGVLALAPAGPGPPPASCDSRPQTEPAAVSLCARTRRAPWRRLRRCGRCDTATRLAMAVSRHGSAAQQARHVNHADNPGTRCGELIKGRHAAMVRWLQWTFMSRYTTLGLSVLVCEYW